MQAILSGNSTEDVCYSIYRAFFFIHLKKRIMKKQYKRFCSYLQKMEYSSL